MQVLYRKRAPQAMRKWPRLPSPIQRLPPPCPPALKSPPPPKPLPDEWKEEPPLEPLLPKLPPKDRAAGAGWAGAELIQSYDGTDLEVSSLFGGRNWF